MFRHVPKLTRDGLLLAGGLAGLLHETLWAKVERPSLLVVFAAMIGLPALLRRDEGKK